MAPAQVIEAKDLPPEVGVGRDLHTPAVFIGAATIAGGARVEGATPAAGAHAQVGSSTGHWETDLETEAVALLGSGTSDVWDVLTRRFESRLILAALASTKGRRIEAAQKLGIGRNTITRKIQELGLE